MKAEARAAAVAAVREGGFGRREVAIRTNAPDTPWFAEDMAAIAASGVDAVLVPKIATPADVLACEAALASAPAALQLWAMIETCGSIARLDELASLAASTRLSLWVIGTNDIAKEMRARLTPGREVFLPLLTLAVCAARAHGVKILDGVCNEFRDLAVFRAEAEQGVTWGFDGKTVIHPDQIAPCNTAFAPADVELAAAQAVIEAFERPENAGKGAIKVDGKMTELLHLEEARRLVALAELIALAERE
jgi:citrate lyase subunit beta/citryl-CoA lyase